MWILGCREREWETMINIGMTKYNLSNESTAFYIKIMKAHSAEEHESAIMKCLSQTRIVTNLLRLQNTTFQTSKTFPNTDLSSHVSFSKPLFSPSLLPPQIPVLWAPEREGERERAQQRRWGERLNLAFREWSGRCLEIFHILFTAGRFQPRTAESWRGPLPGHSSSLSFLSVPSFS